MNLILEEFSLLHYKYINNEEDKKIIEEITKGMIDNMSLEDIYNYISNTCASYICHDPEYNKLAVEYELKNMYLILNFKSHNIKDLIKKQHESGLISDSYINFINDNIDYINEIIINERDNLIDYFGIKTLERSYLLKDKNNKLLENPQMMFMRCAVQIHGLVENKNLDLVKETYDYMSQLYFTHATPTLFNSGGKYPQLSSCYLLQCPDDLKSISKSMSDIMMISKWAGGIGINLSDVRANGALIKSNGGLSSGIIPLCKVLESIARYVNQCFGRETIIYTKEGPKMIDNISTKDEVLTKNGTYQKVIGISEKTIDEELLEINLLHSIELCEVTKVHQLYVIKNKKELDNKILLEKLNLKEIIPEYTSAEEIENGDLMGFPIPKYKETSIQTLNDELFYRLFGIIISNGTIEKIINKFTIRLLENNDTYNFICNYLKSYDINYLTKDIDNMIVIEWYNNTSIIPIHYDSLYKNGKIIIQNEYLHTSDKNILALIDGLIETKIIRNDNIVLLIDTKELVYKIQYLFLRLGILIKVEYKNKIFSLIIPKNFKEQKCNDYFEYDNILWSPIINISKEKYTGTVYDLNIENNHNYTTNMGIVHNSGKRHGSICCYIETWHYDIFDFIDLRKNTGDENLRARDLFLGLWVPNAFMRAVENDDDWYLMSPDVSVGLTEVHSEEFDKLYEKYVLENKYVKKIKATDLYKKILEAQLETGMPYMLYKDHANSKSNQKNLGTIKNSNLCVSPETMILTENGYYEIKSLENKLVKIWNGEKFSEVKVIKTGENQKLLKVTFSNGETLTCTPYHKFYIDGDIDTEKVETKDLKEGMRISLYDLPIIEVEIKNKIGESDIFDILDVPINDRLKNRLEWLSELSDRYGKVIKFEDNRSLEIDFKSISNEILNKVRLLLTTLGVYPKIKDFVLTINYHQLYKLIELGFKTNRLDITCKKPNYKVYTYIVVVKVEDENRTDDTYCFNEPENHKGIFNGILTGNCSEIIEYSSADEIAVCNLASICLPKFVEDNKFNYDKLGKITKIIVNNLNNIIDINFYPVIETQISNLRHRPIGLGVQGLADTYAKLDLAFDSKEAIEINKKIFECIYYNALSKSNELAIKYGKYSSYEGSPFSEGLFQYHLANYKNEDMNKELNYNWDELVESVKKYGTRNSLLTTIMPTASTAQIMNNNESIEPFASNIYVRKTLAGDYIIVNKYLINDLKKINKWNNDIYQEIIYDNGSIQNLDIDSSIKEKYKTAYELKQSVLLKQSVDRSLFIDQSQSLNIFMSKPDFRLLHTCHMYSWKNGLKTGMYYLRSQPATEGIKFGIDSEVIKTIKNKRNIEYLNRDNNENTCEMCSA